MPRTPRPLPERFWSKVEKRDANECWLWKAGRRGKYGVLRDWRSNTTTSAHRLSWQLANGSPVPDGLVVMHSCDNPICVNPAHLSIGTARDNYHDCLAKGRSGAQRITHCPQGHEYTPQNTDIQSLGRGRRCRACHRERERLRRAAKNLARKEAA